MDHEGRDRNRRDRNRRQILDRIVGWRAHDHRADDELARGAGEKCLPVRLRARDRLRGDDAAATTLVLDHHIANGRLDLLRPKTCDDIHHAASSAWYDEADRPIREFALGGCEWRTNKGRRP